MTCYYIVCQYQYNTEIRPSRRNGNTHQELSKTQAHEVVVPWQHQAVPEEEASTTKEEPVDIDGGGSIGTVIWVSRFYCLSYERGRGRCKLKPMAELDLF